MGVARSGVRPLLQVAFLLVAQASLSFSATCYGGTEGDTVVLEVRRPGAVQGEISLSYEGLAASADESDAPRLRGRLKNTGGLPIVR